MNRVLVLALILAAGLFLPSAARLGFFADDFVLLAAQDGSVPHKLSTPLDIYAFATGDAAATAKAIHDGNLPWWHNPEHRHAYWRPVTSALFALDYRLFGRAYAGYAVHSLLWFLLAVVAVWLLCRRSLPGAVGALAVLLFAATDVHLLTTIWAAARHHVIATALGLLGVAAHVRWREDGWRPGRWVSLLLFVPALLAGETALQALGYLAAYELFAAKGSLREKAQAIAGACVIAAVYLVAYKLQGYGVRAYDPSDPMSYADPLSQPGRFLLSVTLKLPYYLLVPFVGPLRAAIDTLPPGVSFVPLVLIGAPLWWWVGKALKAMDPEEARGARWLIAGGLIATVPALATLVSDPAYFAPSLGGSVTLAVALRHAWVQFRQRAGTPWLQRFGRTVVVGWLTLLAISMPLAWAGRTAFMRWLADASTAPLLAAPIDYEARNVLVSGQPLYVMWGGDLHALAGRRMEEPLWILSPEATAHSLTRTAPDTLELEFRRDAGSHGWLSGSAPPYALHEGQEIDTRLAHMKVLAVDGALPRRLELRFTQPLDDPKLRFLAWHGRALQRITVPPVGGRMDLPADFGDVNPEDLFRALFAAVGATFPEDEPVTAPATTTSDRP